MKNYSNLTNVLLVACIIFAGTFAFKVTPQVLTDAQRTSLKEFSEVITEGFSDISSEIAGVTEAFDFKALFSSEAAEAVAFADEVKLVKTVNNAGGGTLLGDADPGQNLIYDLRYENRDSGPVANYTIIDTIPNGINYVGNNGGGTYDPVTRVLTVNVGNLAPGAQGNLQVNVQVVNDPVAFRDACSSFISNQAYGVYNGLQEASYLGFADASPAPATFFVSANELNYTRTEAICGTAGIDISATGGFDSYTWTRNGAFVGNTQTVTATDPGTYVVEKTVQCNGRVITYTETLNLYDVNGIANPILNFADDIGTCPNNGSQMPNLLLCGTEGSRTLNIGFSSTASSITWKKQNGSCTSIANCANASNACWTSSDVVGSGDTFTVSEAGSYRVEVLFEGNSGANCLKIYYFNVYKDQLNASVSVTSYSPSSLGTISIDAGGVGPQYTYSIDGPDGYDYTYGPTTENSHVFKYLIDGDYTVTVSSDTGCSYTEVVTITDNNPLWFDGTLFNIKDCNRARIRLQRGGGDPPYQFAIWSINGVPKYETFQEIPDSKFSNEESESTGGSQARVYEFLIEEEGDYIFVMRDDSGNFTVSGVVPIALDPSYRFDVNPEDVLCYGGSDGSVSLYFYSDRVSEVFTELYDADTYVYGGTNTPLFTGNGSGTYPNLSAGDYIIEVTITLKRGNSTCSFIRPFTINQPDAPLEAYAGVITDVSCIQNIGASEVKIANASGGTPPYTYIFNGVAQASNIGYLANDGIVSVVDANGCTYDMFVDVNAATEIPSVDYELTYNCDGTGNVALTPSVADPNLVYIYEYSMNGDYPVSDSLFTSLPPGNYNFRLYYENATPDNPTPGLLLEEDFGTGENTTLREINPVYKYESQVVGQDPPAGDDDAMLDDGEYVVTSSLQPIGGQQWFVPSDVDGEVGGRYLAVNIGDVVGAGGIIYDKMLTDLSSGSEITVELSIINLLLASSGQCDPDLIVELLDVTGQVVDSKSTGAIDNNEQWHNIAMTLNSGGNSQLRFRIRSNSTCLSGNDIAIDGLRVYQVPEICTAAVDVPIVVQDNEAFAGEIIAQSDLSCANMTNPDGSITFAVYNFDPVTGYEYSVNGGPWIASTDAQVQVNGLGLGAVTVDVRVPGDGSCDFTMDASAPIGQPQELDLEYELTKQITCDATNPGASVNLTATGGTPPYEYGIDDGSGSGVTYGGNSLITGLLSGNYEFWVRDANGCETNIGTPVVLEAPEPILFDVTPTVCYNGSNGEIVVTVTQGNGDYQFSLNGTAWFSPDPATPDTYTFGSLSPGSYNVYVRDGSNCQEMLPATIDPQIGISVTSQANVDCFGEANGSAVLTVTDFIPPYTYTVNGANAVTQSGSTINLDNLSAGTYTVAVTDDRGCNTTAMVTIDAPADALTATLDVTDLSCVVTSGRVVVNATGGYGNYRYTLTYPDGTTTLPQNNNRFTNLTQTGTYTVTVTDAGGCNIPLDFTLNTPVPPSLTLGSAGCYDGTNNVTITATPTGGVAPYTYRINGGAFQASNTFDVAPGTYTVTVRDALDCEDTASITIDTQLQLTATAGNIAACGGNTDITATASGGDGNYVFAFVPAGQPVSAGDFTPSSTYNTTLAGDYDVYVRDNSGNAEYCETVYTITIGSTTPVEIFETHVNVNCNGAADGSISLSATGGTAPYQYSIDNGSTFVNTPDFYNLPAGTYEAVVRDVNGCLDNVSIEIEQPDPLSYTHVETAYTCSADAQTTITATGGSGTYEFSLDGGAWQSSNVFTGLQDGSYTIRVRDANAVSCTYEDVIIIDPLPVAPVLSAAVAYTCDGLGDITVTPFDAAWTYTLLDNTGAQVAAQTGPNANIFIAQASGTYTVEVDYGSDCTTTLPVVVEGGQDFGAGITGVTHVSCNGATDGSLTFEVTNFDTTAGYQYSYDGGATWTASTSATETINGLAAGTYTIDIQFDSAGSCVQSLTETITQPDALTAGGATIVEATCNAGATVQATASGGTRPYEFRLLDSSSAVFNGYDYSSNDTFTDLPNGDYTIEVRDANGCTASFPITVDAPTDLAFTAVASTCYAGDNNGTVTVTIDPVNNGNGNLQVSLNGGPFVPLNNDPTGHTFTGLSAGSYDIEVRDGFGCPTAPQTVTISEQVVANAILDADLTCSADAQITVNATGGTAPYTFAWGTTASGPFTAMGSNVFNTNAEGTYYFEVTDVNGCSDIAGPVTVTPADPPVFTLTQVSDILCFGGSNGAFQVNIDTTVGVGPYRVEVNGVDYGTQTTISGLTAGTYTVVVFDSKGCASLPQDITIGEPSEITYNVDLDPITCSLSGSGTTPGAITVSNVSGGTPGYTYYLTSNNGFSDSFVANSGEDHIFTILDFGIYQLDIIDSNGCSIRREEIIASPPDDLDINIATPTADCVSGGTAIVSVSSAVGSGNYEFAILETFSAPYSTNYMAPDVAGGDTKTFTGLTPGITYTFVVHDLTTNCYYFESADGPILTPSNMTIDNLIPNNVTCTGAADGSVTFTLDNYDGGASAVEWEIFNAQTNITTGQTGTIAVNPPTGPVTETAGILAPGYYYVLFREIGGAFDQCTVGTQEFSIIESTNPLQIAATSINATCNTDGVITATAQFGTAPYTFIVQPDTAPAVTDPQDALWTSGAQNSNGVFNVAAGNYVVYVKDANNCIQSVPVTVDIDPQPVITAAVDDYCVSEGNFSATVSLTSVGMPPYQIRVDGAAFQNVNLSSGSAQVTGLNSGTHTIEVRDANGCTTSATIDIVEPLEFSAEVSRLFDCNGPGEITINNLIGSGNYEIAITGPGIDLPRTAIASVPFTYTDANAAGVYSITVWDMATADACSVTKNVEILAPIQPSFTLLPQHVSCNGGNDGSIIINQVDNGTLPLTYTISPMPAGASFNATTNTFEGLTAGPYTITGVSTVNGCSFVASTTVNEPTALSGLTLVPDQFDCTVGNTRNSARVSASGVTGGTPPYTYTFVYDNGTTADTTDDLTQSGTSTSYVVSNPLGGSVTVTVYDANGCSDTHSETILPFVRLEDVTTLATDPTCLTGDGSITVNTTVDPALGTTNLQYDILQIGGSYNDSFTGNTATHTFNGLDFGDYQITVTNTETGCQLVVTESLNDPDTFELDIVAGATCYGASTGEVTITMIDTDPTTNGDNAGDFNYTITDTGGTIVASGTSSGVTLTIPNLPAGTYDVTATLVGAPQCTVTDSFIIVEPSEPLAATTVVTNPTCLGNDGVIEILATGGWGGITYFVADVSQPAPAGTDFVSSPRFENLVAGTYQVWIQDQNGCIVQLGDELLIDPTPITADITSANPNCAGLSGEITVENIAGGYGSAYTLQLIKNGVPFGAPVTGVNTTYTFTGLGAGTYQVEISDAWSCDVVIPTSIEMYEEFIADATIDSNLSCDATNGSVGGQITLSATGGSGDFAYSATYPDGTTIPFGSSAVFSGLTLDGTYTFTVRDNITLCEETTTIEMTAPVIPVIQDILETNVTCFGNDGTVTVELDPSTMTDPPYIYEISQGGSVLQTNNDGVFTGLPDGSYDITVTSDAGCFVTGIATVGTDPTPEIDLEITDNCDPSGQYEITVNMTQEGIAPYTLSVNGAVRPVTIDSSTPYVITGLSAGTYDIAITDANGCGVNVTGTIDIVPLDYSAQVTGLLYCDGPAAITIDNISGSGPFAYAIDGPGAADQAQTTLDPAGTTWNGATVAGTYTITVYDLNGTCSLTREVVVPERVEPVINLVSLQDPSCSGDLGQIIVSSPDNGIGPFTFEIVDIDGTAAAIAPNQTDGYTATFSNLNGDTAGITYTIRATAQNGCVVEISETITSPEPVAMPTPRVTHFSCNAGSNSFNNALVVVDPATITGGSGSYVRYAFNFNGVTQVSSNPQFIVTDTRGGTGTVTVYDSNNCSVTRNFIIDPFIGIENPQLNVDTTATCVNGEDVTVSVDIFEGLSGTPGTTDLLYTLTDINGNPLENSGTITATGSSSHTFSGLAPGAYFINILNEYTGCEVSLSHTVDDPNTFVMTATVVDPTCFGEATGSVELTMIDTFLGDGNQAGSFDYEIRRVSDDALVASGNSNGLSNITVGSLPAGHYAAIATITSGGLGCSVEPTEFTITQPQEDLTATIEEVHNVTCLNNRGEIYVDASGGYPYYEITLVGQNTGYSETHTNVDGWVFLGLEADIYTAYITDAQGCTFETLPVELIRPEFISAEITGQPTTCFGSNTGEVSAINITGGAGPDSYYFELYDQAGNQIGESQESPVFTELVAGSYYIKVLDPWDCDFETEVFVVTDPQEISVNVTDQPTVVCYGTTDGYYEFNMTGGTAPYTVSLYHPDSDTPVETFTGIGLAEAVTFWDLEGDVEYRVEVTDANTCTTETTFMIPTGPDLSAAVDVVYECSTNLPENYIEVSLINSTLDLAEVMYALNTDDINQAVLFNEIIDGKGIVRNVPAGADQFITIFHEGCAQVMPAGEFFEVIAYEPLELSLANEQLNVIDFNATGGQPPYNYYVNGEYRGDDADYRIRETGTYEVVVVDANGCESRAEIFVEFYDIDIPNFFTPDGDSNNDVWGPANSEAYPTIRTRVYDRYGRVVGEMRVGQFWDGTYNGSPLPTGDYWYVIKFDEEEDAREFVGHFTLYR